MSKINILVFGTNQYYETPYTILENYLESYDKSEITNKKESSISFDYTFFPTPEQIKLIFIKNLEKTYSICKECNAIIIFIDLEGVDSLDKLDSISSYIKENCNLDITILVIGKYNTIEDKIKLFDEEYMKQYLQEKSLTCKYFEFCTEPKKEFEEKIGYFLHALIGELKDLKLKNGEYTTKDNENNNTNYQSNLQEELQMEYDGAESNSGCILE